MKLPKDWHEFFALLHSNQVEYVIVGAWALNVHGKPRFTGDIDLFVRPTLENGERLLRVLVKFGFLALGLSATDLSEPDRRLLLGREPCRIDIMTGISGVTFEEVWSGKIYAKLDGVELPFIGISEFLKNKLSTSRDKDKVDAAELQRFIAAKKR